MKKKYIIKEMIVMPNNKAMRTAVIRVSGVNIVNQDNDILGVKAGDEVRYTKEMILDVLNDWTKTKDIKYFMIEHNEDPDNVHFHIVIIFPKDSICKFDTLKKKFPYGFIENAKSVKGSVQYLVHMNNPEKHQYDWSDVETNAPDKLENYKIPGQATMNAKLENVLHKIIAGEIKEYEIDKIEPDIYIKHKRKIKDAFEYRQLIIAKNPNRNLQVIVCQGPPRVGKSLFTKVYAEKYHKSICFSSSSNDPWQEYMGEDCFVYDDFNYVRNKVEDLLKAFDPHNLTSVSARYKNRLFVGDTIFICTNVPIESWYTWVADDHRKALFARISCVMEFIDINNGVARYTLNSIVDSGYVDHTTCNGRVENVYTKMVLSRKEDSVREFDLTKYIDIHADENKTQEFISQLADI